MTAFFSSVKLTIILMASMAIFVLLGAWCPQISQSGQDKVIEQFGQQTADILIKAGIADIFHSPAFLLLIALLTINIIMGSCKHVFPKLKLLRLPMPRLESAQINKLPIHKMFVSKQSFSISQTNLVNWLSKKGYSVNTKDNYLTAESGKYGRLAPTITHIGLLSLLTGLIISSWTGFSGFRPATPGESFSLADAQHSHLWIGSLPKWFVRINETHREDYDNGDVKQWYSDISITDKAHRLLKNQIISVNNPLTYDGVDIYQSSWSLKSLKLHFNGKPQELTLQPMGKLFAAFLPLPDDAVIIFSVRDQHSPLRIFAKRKDWPAPKLITQVLPGHKADLGDVSIVYDGTVAMTGLQYKCDPGFPIVCFAFALITAGVSIAAVSHRQIWAHLEKESVSASEETVITLGGTTKKGKQALAKQIESIADGLQKQDNKLEQPTFAIQTTPYQKAEKRIIEEIQSIGKC